MAAAVLAPVLTPALSAVGLQVVLQPYGAASTIGKAACTAAGLIYPAYQTLKVVEQRPPSAPAANKWMTYWAIYGLITAAEKPLDKLLQWVPYYHAVKLLLLLWLQSPAYEGAARIYVEGLRPWLLKWQPTLDDVLGGLLRSLRRPEVQVVSEAVHQLCQRVPGLEWMVRGPGGRPAPPRAFITDGSSAQ